MVSCDVLVFVQYDDFRTTSCHRIQAADDFHFRRSEVDKINDGVVDGEVYR
jgi:hypothetical protein